MAETEPSQNVSPFEYFLGLCGQEEQKFIQVQDFDLLITKRIDEYDAASSSYIELEINGPYGLSTYLIDPKGIFYGYTIAHQGVHVSNLREVWLADITREDQNAIETRKVMRFIEYHVHLMS